MDDGKWENSLRKPPNIIGKKEISGSIVYSPNLILNVLIYQRNRERSRERPFQVA